MLMGENHGECWSMVSKLRRAVGDKLSPLNTIGNMKCVFNGCVLRVFDLDDTHNSGKVVRYQVRAPNVTDIRACPPRNSTGDIPRRSSRPSTSPVRMQLPPDASHVPFDVLLVPSNLKAPVSPKRHVNIALPPKESSRSSFLQVDTRFLGDLLAKDRPGLPSTLIKTS